jgi:DNA helicase MCM8
MVGNPGIGKTKLLRAAVAASGRGIFVSAGSTKAGLTATVNKDLADNQLTPGALVIADEGVCAIDELDKFGNERQAFLEVME